jgi:hypothetical protein
MLKAYELTEVRVIVGLLTAENLMKAHFHLRQNSCKFDFVTQFGTVDNSVDPIYSPEALFLCFSG